MTGAGEPAQHPRARLLLRRGEVFGCQCCRLCGPHPQPLSRFAGEGSQCGLARPRPRRTPRRSRSSGSEHEHSTRCQSVATQAHRPQPPARAAAALTPPRLDDAQQDVQHRAERVGIALQEVAQALRAPTTPIDAPAAGGRPDRPDARPSRPCAGRCRRGIPRGSAVHRITADMRCAGICGVEGYRSQRLGLASNSW